MRPVLLTVDDDPQVVRAIERDLRQQYGKRFRILKAESGQEALELVKKLKLRNEILALLLVDQRMPQMSGLALLEEVMNIFPEAKRVLLTAYADTDAAIRSINKAKIDYYLMKPWDPPEEHLYPILDDLLDDWWALAKPPFEGIRVIGLRWSPKSYDVKHFLARNGIPYQWLDLEASEEAHKLVSYLESTGKNGSPGTPSAVSTTATTTSSSSFSIFDNNKTDNNNSSSTRSASSPPYSSTLHLPIVMFPDGPFIEEPSNPDLTEKIGLKTHAQMPFYSHIYHQSIAILS
jgi:thioredoxin reductase (NADPH)